MLGNTDKAGFIGSGKRTVDYSVANQFCTDVFNSAHVAGKEVASEGCLRAPLGVKGLLGLHDNEHLEGVFKGNLLQGAVAEGVFDPTSIAVDLDMLFLVSCHCFQKIARFRCLVQGVMMKAPLLVGGLTEGKVQKKSFSLKCPALQFGTHPTKTLFK